MFMLLVVFNLTEGFASNPCTALSTYLLLAPSLGLVGSAKLTILKLFKFKSESLSPVKADKGKSLTHSVVGIEVSSSPAAGVGA